MKKVTVSLDDETYRAARATAAEQGRSLLSLVRDFLREFGSGESQFDRVHREELALRTKLLETPTGFRASDRLTRDEIYNRASARNEWNEAREQRS